MRIAKNVWAMGIAQAAAARSEDPFFRVGAVALREDWSVIGVGYNGLPAGVDVDPVFWHDRNARRPFMIHAEINALRYARAGEVYRIVTTAIPCGSCMSVLGSYRVKVVEYAQLLGEAHDIRVIEQVASLNSINLYQLYHESET